jgi:hypothetical protein
MASNVFSRLVTKYPSLLRTAPKTPMLFRVGACRTMGSISSGGIHIAHRDPCCWKWHSSSNQRSTSFLSARRRSFFKISLRHRISVSNNGARFSPAESQLMEQPLALSNSDIYSELLGQVVTQELSIPQILRVSQIAWRTTQITPDTLLNVSIQGGWASRSLNLLKTSKTASFKTMNPVLYGSRTVPEKLCHLRAAISGAYQKDAMKLMIVSRLIGSQNFLLHRYSHDVRIFDFEFAHKTPYLQGV